MIQVLVGDLFESGAQTLVNTVNLVGVMGKGVALGFKKRFPEMYRDYLARCQKRQVQLGRPYLFQSLVPPWIINFPTKDHWRSVARLEDIVRGLEYLEKQYREWGVTSMAVPPLGCGEGQLEWRVVGPTLYRHLSRLEIPVEMYAPYGTPQAEMQATFLAQSAEEALAGTRGPLRIQPAWIALLEILARIEAEPYHWPVGRTTFQKITYFATEAGVPTGLAYSRGSYGPYAPDLKARIAQLVNNGLIREELLGRMLAVKVGPTFEDARSAYRADIANLEPAIDRVADLFLRVRTDQAELAATVHFAAESLAQAAGHEPSERQVLEEVMQWKQRRRPPIDSTETAKTIRNLAVLGWVHVTPSPDLPVPDEEALGV